MPADAFEAVIFDCDGVLVDTESISNRAWQIKLAETGVHLSLQQLQELLTGKTTQANLDDLSTLLGRPLSEDFSTQVNRLFRAKINQHLPLIPGIESALQNLPQPKATATNAKRRELDFKLARSGLKPYFEFTICCEDVAFPKPNPEMYLRAAKALKVANQRCLVIEDSIAGIQAGVAAGMTVFGYCRDTDKQGQMEAGARQCFTNMEMLPSLVLC